MTSKPKRYASADNPTIQAVIHGMYRFASEAEAMERLETLRQHFIPSKQQIVNEAHPSLHLWIKGFGLTEEDKKSGVIGHFAIIACEAVEGKWRLSATKLHTPASQHPQRAQVKRDNPNWGHPVLRSVRKKKSYSSIEAAQGELDLLHTQFPKVSIPNPGKLYIMIYCVDRPAKQRMVKHILTIQPQEDATYYIECKENIPKPKSDAKKRVAPVKGEKPIEPKGSFTAKVALQRHKKGRRTLTPKQDGDGQVDN